MIKTIEWTDEGVRMIDQRKLPTVEEYPVFRTYEEVAEAIRVMVVRGAPAIGVAAAMGVALGVRSSKAETSERAQGGLRNDHLHARSHAADCGQPVLGDRTDEADVHHAPSSRTPAAPPSSDY